MSPRTFAQKTVSFVDSKRPDSSFFSNNKNEIDIRNDLLHYESDDFYSIPLTNQLIKSKATRNLPFFMDYGYTQEEQTLWLLIKRKIRAFLRKFVVYSIN